MATAAQRDTSSSGLFPASFRAGDSLFHWLQGCQAGARFVSRIGCTDGEVFICAAAAEGGSHVWRPPTVGDNSLDMTGAEIVEMIRDCLDDMGICVDDAVVVIEPLTPSAGAEAGQQEEQQEAHMQLSILDQTWCPVVHPSCQACAARAAFARRPLLYAV